MNPEHVRVLVARRMQQATEALEDGRYLLAAGRGARTAVNRAYYAAFYAVLALLQALDVCFINTPPVPQSFSWERHAPAWLLEPGWSPAIPGESPGEGLTKWTYSMPVEQHHPALERILSPGQEVEER